MNYVVDKVKGGVKRGCVHFDTPSFCEVARRRILDAYSLFFQYLNFYYKTNVNIQN